MNSLEQAVATAERVPGWMSRPELQWIATRAAEIPAGGAWLEIGVMVGRSWICQALALPSGCLLAAIDLGLGTYTQTPATFRGGYWAAEWPAEWTWQQTLALLHRNDLRWMAIRDTSIRAADLFAAASLDAVFIDACHTYPGTREQIEVYRTKLKPGGLLCGHDHDSKNWPGVVQAVDELLPERHLVPGTSLWWVRV